MNCLKNLHKIFFIINFNFSCNETYDGKAYARDINEERIEILKMKETSICLGFLGGFSSSSKQEEDY